VEMAPQKRQLLTQQHDEYATLLAELEQLNAKQSKDLEKCRRQVRKKRYIHEITRAHRYPEDKSFWEYLNNIVEDIHLFTFRKSAIAQCTSKYQRKRQVLEEELRDLKAQHRKERISLRYESPSEVDEQPPNIKASSPRFFMS